LEKKCLGPGKIAQVRGAGLNSDNTTTLYDIKSTEN